MTREVYILAGQSNMAGMKQGSPTYANASRIYRLKQPWNAAWGTPCQPHAPDYTPTYPAGSGTWDLAVDPIHSHPQCGVGPGIAFADRLIDLRGDPALEIGLVPCAWPGSTINGNWRSDYLWWTAFGTTVARIKEAKKWGPVKGLIWYQGESEALNSAPSYIQAAVQRVLRDLTFEIGYRVPTIVTVIGPNPGAQYPGWAATQNYLRYMDGVADAVVSAADLANDPADPVHLTAASCVTLGHRYADAMHAML